LPGRGARYSPGHRRSTYKETQTLSLFRETLANRDPDKPLFVLVNLNTPHSPYNSAEQFSGTFVSDPSLKLDRNQWYKFFLKRRRFSEKEMRHLTERYDEEILYSDHVIGEMMNSLKTGDLWDESLFMVTSDHGENFGDHDMVDHVFSLHQSIVKIPLILHFPSAVSKGVEDPSTVQILDIFPTLIEAAGLSPDRYPNQGRSLLGDEPPPSDRVAFIEYYYPTMAMMGFAKQARNAPALIPYKRRLRALVSEGFKLIWAGDGKHELYDLIRDPDEKHNLAHRDQHRTRMEKLLGQLEALVEAYVRVNTGPPSQATMPGDEETINALKGLGYLK